MKCDRANCSLPCLMLHKALQSRQGKGWQGRFEEKQLYQSNTFYYRFVAW